MAIAEAGAKQQVVIADNVPLDFSGLFSQEKQAPTSPIEPLLEGGEYKTIAEQEKPVKRQIEGLERE